MHYLYLLIAIVSEVAATTALKSSQGFTRWLPSLVVVVGYSLAFYCMSLSLKKMEVGIVYAIWCGVGIVLVALAGFFFHKERYDLPALAGMALIVIGVVLLFGFSRTPLER